MNLNSILWQTNMFCIYNLFDLISTHIETLEKTFMIYQTLIRLKLMSFKKTPEYTPG